MNQVRINVLASAGLLLSFTSQAFAQEKVCLMEGIFPLGDEKIETKDS